MSEEAALLAAIRADHADDMPRLVYADWLQENGDEPRAQFIRYQCAAKRLPTGSVERSDAAYEADELLEEYGAKWFGKLQEHFDDGCYIERGFVWRLYGDMDQFKKHSRTIAKYAPVLESASVWNVEKSAIAALKLPVARAVRVLMLCNVTPKSFAALGKAKLPPNVGELVLLTEGVKTFDAVERFLDSPFVRTPPWLEITFDFYPDGAGPNESEEAEPHNRKLIERLTELDLPNLRGFGTFGINDATAELIAEWPGLKRVEDLNFHCSWIDDTALPILLKSPHLGNIRSAFFNENYLGARSAKAIANCPKFKTATTLDLSDNSIRDAGAKHLAQSRYLKNLTYLSLFGNSLSNRGHAAMRKRFGEAYHTD